MQREAFPSGWPNHQKMRCCVIKDFKVHAKGTNNSPRAVEGRHPQAVKYEMGITNHYHQHLCYIILITINTIIISDLITTADPTMMDATTTTITPTIMP